MAFATNDDYVTVIDFLIQTLRRYKDLQNNKKPEIFFMAELVSDIIKREAVKNTKSTEVKPQRKV